MTTRTFAKYFGRNKTPETLLFYVCRTHVLQQHCFTTIAVQRESHCDHPAAGQVLVPLRCNTQKTAEVRVVPGTIVHKWWYCCCCCSLFCGAFISSLQELAILYQVFVLLRCREEESRAQRGRHGVHSLTRTRISLLVGLLLRCAPHREQVSMAICIRCMHVVGTPS